VVNVEDPILWGTIKRATFRKVRTETILKIYNTLVLPAFLYESENWTPTASQRRRTEAAEMKSLRPLAGYTLYDHKAKDYIRRELQITGILDKIDEYTLNWFQHLQRMPQNRILLKSHYYKEGEQLEDQRNVGESSCNFGDGCLWVTTPCSLVRCHRLTFRRHLLPLSSR